MSFTGKIGKEPDGSFRQTHCVFKDISAERAYQKDLVQAKAEAEQLFKPNCEQKGVELSFYIPLSLPNKVIRGQQRLQQILNNIFGDVVNLLRQVAIDAKCILFHFCLKLELR